MKVRLLVGFAGPEILWEAGQVVEVDDATAERMLAAGFAELAEEIEAPEKKARSKVKKAAQEIE